MACGVRGSCALRALEVRKAQCCNDDQGRQDGVEQIGSRPGYSTLPPCFSAGAGYSGCGLAVDVFGSQHALDSSPMDSDAGPLGMETTFAAPRPCASQESSDPAAVSLFLRGVGGLRAGYPAVTEQSNPIVQAQSVKSRRNGGFRASVDPSDRALWRSAAPAQTGATCAFRTVWCAGSPAKEGGRHR